MRCGHRCTGCAVIAFGAGLIVASCFPKAVVVIILAAALVILGLASRC
ncbi:MAG: hypothetical protein GX824_03825 [Clostridiales bacterium]|nr:hypothetical protein [Clostridiales bacterium]